MSTNQISINVRGELAKIVGKLNRKWGINKSDVVRSMIIEYCNDRCLFDDKKCMIKKF